MGNTGLGRCAVLQHLRTVEQAGQRDIRQSVLLAAVLLLIGFSGIVLLFLAQAYRSTRTSLTRIKAFSEKVVESMPIGLLALDDILHCRGNGCRRGIDRCWIHIPRLVDIIQDHLEGRSLGVHT